MKPIIKDLKVHLDERGYLFEILRDDDPFFCGFGQSYISTINPGVIKGFHVHYKKTDFITCIVGQVKFVMIESDDENNVIKNLYEVHLGFMCPKLVVVPPGFWHGWMCVGTDPAVLVNLTTEAYDEKNNDEVRVHPINNPWKYVWEIKHY